MSNGITFLVQKGGLSRTATDNDHISALVFSANPPSSWGTARVKKYFSLTQAETDGFVADSATFGEYWYHISEFFRMNSTGALWLLMNATNMSETFISTCQGEVRQIGAYVDDVANIQSIWQTLADTLRQNYCEPQILLGWNGATAIDPTTATFNMQLKNSPNVSLLGAGDGGAKGAALATALGKSYIPSIGAYIGAESRAKVSENVGWVERFNFSDGRELETIRLSTGATNPTYSAIAPYDTAKIIIFRKEMNYGGTYINDTYTAVTATDDFATRENNRTMQKAKRLIHAALLPHRNRPLKVDPNTGKMQAGIVAFMEGIVKAPLDVMQLNDELSGCFVSIDPNQNILSTSVLVIDVGITPVGVARQINVKIGYRVVLNTNF
jgi:hypothetical protein